MLGAHMNFLKRAATSVLRRSGKTVILLLLVFILGTVIAGAISVRGAINNTDANLRRRMSPIVSVGIDEIAWSESIDWDDFDFEDPDADDPWLTRETLNLTHIREIGALPQVSFYDYMITTPLNSFELQRYENNDVDEWEIAEGIPQWFDLRGTSRTELVKIEEGIINLVQGRQFENSELAPNGESTVAIVSEAFANENDLSLGSTFELYAIVRYPDDPDDDVWHWGDIEARYAEENIYELVAMEFEIIGLYDIPMDSSQEDGDDENTAEDTSNLNNIYVPNWALEDVITRHHAAELSAWEASEYDMPNWIENQFREVDGQQQMRVLPIFMLEDPAYTEEFREAAEPLLPPYHVVEDLSSSFDDIASSMDTMQTIANWILYVSIGATLLILSLLITLFLRDRRYEMGVYLALGERKGKIVAQILLEVVVTAFVGITLAVFAGNFISSTISENMLRNALVEETNQDDSWGWGMMPEWTVFDEIGIPTSMSVDEMVDAFQVTLSAETIGLFYLIGLGAVVLSTIIPVIYVVTLNPKKVLM